MLYKTQQHRSNFSFVDYVLNTLKNTEKKKKVSIKTIIIT